MDKTLLRMTQDVESVENQYRLHNPNNTESASMLNLGINSVEVSLYLAKNDKQNEEYINQYDSLISRIETIKEKVKLRT